MKANTSSTCESDMTSIALSDIHVSYMTARRMGRRSLKSAVRETFRPGSRSPAGRGEVRALRGVSLNLKAGDVAGIIGENGAGKTTLLKVLSGLLEPDSGRVEVTGSVATVFNLGAGFLPDLTGRENIHLVGSLHGLSRGSIQELEEPIIEFSELSEAMDRPVKTYSAGMRARLGFSIVAFLDSDIIVLDEVLSAGDFHFRKKAGNLIDRFAHERKILVVVSHSASTVRRSCNICYYLTQGRLEAMGDPEEILPLYTASVRRGGKPRTRRRDILGQP
jgi:ABC-type polysaccharide/polyol phosphate transport system ATPase subunit